MTRDYRAWRAAHPEYRRREVARMTERRRLLGREDRRAGYANRNAARHASAPAAIPTLHTGHPLFELARAVVRDVVPMAVWKSWRELDREDARSEAVLAALEGRDPQAAALGFLRSEAGWHRITATLVEAAA